MRRSLVLVTGLVAAAASVVSALPSDALNSDTLVSVGSPSGPFSANKQNEPAVAIDANHPNVLAAGANDKSTWKPATPGADNTARSRTASAVSASTSRSTRARPGSSRRTRAGSARTARSARRHRPGVRAAVGPIGTLPGYYEEGLVSDGDPAVAFGPVGMPTARSRGRTGRVCTTPISPPTSPAQQAFKGFEAIAVSRIDGPARPADAGDVSNQANWKPPVIVSKQNSASFPTRSRCGPTTRESSPFFGNVYVCSAAFRGSVARHSPSR